MCGICGTLHHDGASVERAVVERMAHSIRHRGPDRQATFVEGPVGLGHARLSILDLSPLGDQPMEAGDAVLVYNGEVYNAAELRTALEKTGVQFRGHSDTEVVLHAYLAWGTDVFRRLNGMFALAIWDRRTQTLHLARDRFGIKPLFVSETAGRFTFGSEIKALLASGNLARDVDAQGLAEYLWYGNTLGQTTLFQGVRQLLPGHRIEMRAGQALETPYWRLEDVPRHAPHPEEAIAQVRERLEQAVRRHLASDVPVGVFLSGGIDSSAVTAFASRHYEGRLASYAVGFDFQESPDELAKARRVAERFGTEHHELHLRGGELPQTIERLVEAHDQPFADAANIPLYLLCEALQGQLRVVLQGDGGDEVFGGYRRYAVASAEAWWRAAAGPAGALLRMLPRSPALHRRARFLRAVGLRDVALRQALLLTMEHYDFSPFAYLNPAWRAQVEQHDPFARYREVVPQFAAQGPVQRALLTDLSILLPDDFLPKVDRATMAHSVEVRVPLLDAELTEYVIGLPASFKVGAGGEKKWVLRQALRGIVPDEVLDGPKTGFGVPYSSWLRGPLSGYLRSVLLDASTRRAALFDPAEVQRAIEDHVAGRRNHGFLLWKLLQLALWHQRYLPA